MVETYYDVLGVSPDATREEIEAAYRERVLETHPDQNDDPDAAEAFDRVTDAEEVLTDGTERARYDRLGHEAYLRFTDRFGAGETGGEATGASSESGEPGGSTTGRGTTTGGRGSASSAGPSESRDAATDSAGARARTSDGDTAGRSHHARQRRRRQRAEQRHRRRDHRRRRGRSQNGNRHRRRDRDERRDTGPSRRGSRPGDPDDDADSFRYSVHDWDDEVEVDDGRRSIDHHTAVFLACLTVLYPTFVFSSVTAAFPPVVNGIVAACTLCLVAYLLTMPRIAAVAFGGWSLLVPAGVWWHGAFDVTLAVAATIVGGFWVPFGYALVVGRVVRP